MKTLDICLPLGLKYGDSEEVIQFAQVRSIDGISRSILTDRTLADNPPKMMNKLFLHNVLKLGEQAPSEDMLASLFTPDRNAIMLQLQVLSYGNEYTSRYRCEWCQKIFEVEEDLNSLEYTSWQPDEWTNEVEVELTDGWTDKEGNVHKDVTLRIPTGKVEKQTFRLLNQNYGKWCIKMIHLQAVKFGTLRMDVFRGIGDKVAEELEAPDIDKLIFALSEGLPGYKSRHDVRCTHCGANQHLPQDMSRFFVHPSL